MYVILRWLSLQTQYLDLKPFDAPQGVAQCGAQFLFGHFLIFELIGRDARLTEIEFVESASHHFAPWLFDHSLENRS